jgi:AcrR family transcriptional regulator
MADRPLRADARRNRERVLDAARAAFAESGTGVPLDEIAARAGVGAGTVYRHFPSKEALFEAVALARVEAMAADARSLAATADPGAALDGFLDRIAAEAIVKRDLTEALSGAGSAALADAAAEVRRAMEALLTTAQQAGAVRPDIGIDDLIALLKGLLHAVTTSEDPGVAQRIVAVVSAGLRQR